MATTILKAMGWDSGNIMFSGSDYYVSSGNSPITACGGKTGAYALCHGSSGTGYYNQWFRLALDGTPNNPSFSAWMYMDGAQRTYATSCSRWEFLLGTGQYVEIRWNSTTYTYDAYVNNGLVAAGSISVGPASGWFHVQMYCTIADAGTIQMKIDGHLSIDYSGDTQPGAVTGATHLYHVAYLIAPGGYYVKVDDLVIGYGGFIGDVRCIDIRPSADTAQDDWTPSAGDNYSTIDESPPSDADYNETNTNAQSDELELGNYDGVTYTPMAITAWVRAKELTANGDSIKVGIDSNGVDDVTESSLFTTTLYHWHTADQNPDGPAAWNDAAIDALKLRYESVIP